MCVCLSVRLRIFTHEGMCILPTYGEYTSALDREITGRPWWAAAARIRRVLEFPLSSQNENIKMSKRIE